MDYRKIMCFLLEAFLVEAEPIAKTYEKGSEVMKLFVTELELIEKMTNKISN